MFVFPWSDITNVVHGNYFQTTKHHVTRDERQCINSPSLRHMRVSVSLRGHVIEVLMYTVGHIPQRFTVAKVCLLVKVVIVMLNSSL